ncbi:DUF5819 family protein [Lysinibacillus xylanilyticus]|uniref:DUF5819 family protein n=1 Tax=Lysinibacillus xylanilyticus TaxID=582475 RepID=UPI002B2525D1|nr:DUF5819 family protein [Lysinibacillus xylanilyticus]MEB2300320.1 DUF5819 family protein [Lysinibacillus xylanilyticus]
MKKIFTIFLALCFCMHFALTAIYVLPLNPVQAKESQLINGYMQPLFTQNWQLFAPNPLSNNVYVFLQAQDSNGEDSEWYDLSSQSYKSNQERRISPNNRLVRIGTSAFLQTVRKDETLEKLKDKISDEELKALEEERGINEYQEQGIEMLYSYARPYVAKLPSPEDIEKIRVRVLIEEAIPYSNKDNLEAKPEKTHVTFDWKEYGL